jgi:hypothetical protein
MVPVYAHAGHVLLDSIVYGGPVVLIAAAVLLFAKFEKRLAPHGAAGEAAREPAGGERADAAPAAPDAAPTQVG